MSLDDANGNSDVVAADGMMLYRFDQACDGWTVENRTYLRLSYGRGTDIETVWTFVSWESADGLSFRFNARYEQDGEVMEKLKGKASLDKEGGIGTAHYTSPENKAVILPEGTMFPTNHMRKIISAAEAGKKMLTEIIFDGSTMENPYEVNAIMGALSQADAEALAKSAGLPVDRAWWTRMAFFPYYGQPEVPEFELSAHYRADGIADRIKQHFDDFTLLLRLKELEVLDPPDC